MLKYAEPGATFLLNSPYRPGRGLGPAAAQRPAADHRQEAEVLRHRRLRGRAADRHGRPHQHHHADLLLRDQRRSAARRSDREIKNAIEKTYGKRGEAVVQKNFAAVDMALGHLHEVNVPGSDHRVCDLRPIGPGCSARVRAGRARRDDRRATATICRSARCPSTAPSPPAPRSGRSATSPWKSRCGTRSSASSAANACWSARTPSSAPRSTSPTY